MSDSTFRMTVGMAGILFAFSFLSSPSGVGAGEERSLLDPFVSEIATLPDSKLNSLLEEEKDLAEKIGQVRSECNEKIREHARAQQKMIEDAAIDGAYTTRMALTCQEATKQIEAKYSAVIGEAYKKWNPKRPSFKLGAALALSLKAVSAAPDAAKDGDIQSLLSATAILGKLYVAADLGEDPANIVHGSIRPETGSLVSLASHPMPADVKVYHARLLLKCAKDVSWEGAAKIAHPDDLPKGSAMWRAEDQPFLAECYAQLQAMVVKSVLTARDYAGNEQADLARFVFDGKAMNRSQLCERCGLCEADIRDELDQLERPRREAEEKARLKRVLEEAEKERRKLLAGTPEQQLQREALLAISNLLLECCGVLYEGAATNGIWEFRNDGSTNIIPDAAAWREKYRWDVVAALDGFNFRDASIQKKGQDVLDHIAGLKPGDKIQVTLYQNGEKIDFAVPADWTSTTAKRDRDGMVKAVKERSGQ